MSKFLSLTNISHGLHRLRPSELLARGSNGWNIFFGVFFVLAIMANVVTFSSASTRGYHMKKLDKRITELKRENQKLNLEIASLSSPKVFDEAAKRMGMVNVKEVRYLSPTTGVVVLR